MEKSNKQKFGQYFTTNYSYILQNLSIPNGTSKIIEPFAGNGDLLCFIENRDRYTIECYDIDPRFEGCIRQDTIQNPPCYENAFILTNPPYLARNKCSEKTAFDLYDVNDLYKCFLKEITSNNCDGGIFIVPLNFWCSIRNFDIELRKTLLEIYDIVQLNIFEEQVFEDTTSSVCAFQIVRRKGEPPRPIPMTIYPYEFNMNIYLNETNDYTFGGEIYHLKTKGIYKITRLTSKNAEKKNTNLLVKCIDDNEFNQIGLSLVPDDKIYIDNTPNRSARTYATLIIDPPISLERQKTLVEEFNAFLKTSDV
jgi:hypothetical protein